MAIIAGPNAPPVSPSTVGISLDKAPPAPSPRKGNMAEMAGKQDKNGDPGLGAAGSSPIIKAMKAFVQIQQGAQELGMILPDSALMVPAVQQLTQVIEQIKQIFPQVMGEQLMGGLPGAGMNGNFGAANPNAMGGMPPPQAPPGVGAQGPPPQQ